MDTEPLDIKNEPFAALSGNQHGSAWSVLVFYYAREVAFLLDYAKIIKKTFAIAVDKDSLNVK